MESGKIVDVQLRSFVGKYLGADAVESVDEIVLGYATGVLSDIDPEGRHEDFDVDDFVAVMDAYVCGFDRIPSGDVRKWACDLAKTLKTTPEVEHDDGRRLGSLDSCFAPSCLPARPSLIPRPARVTSTSTSSSSSSSSGGGGSWCPDSTMTAAESISSQEDIGGGGEMALLTEMFPTACSMELRHCLASTNYDPSNAAQLVLEREACGQAISVPSDKLHKPVSAVVNDEKELRNKILSKYSYIDQEDDKKEHKPCTPKSEAKKLVRYRNGQVVSLKGERFSEIKRAAEDNKTCANSKSSKQRFQ